MVTRKSRSPSDLPSENPAPKNDRTDGRTGDGKFARGNRGGPGNPFARRTAALRKLFLETSEERWPKVIDALFEKAEAGCVEACKVVVQYTLGKPAKMPEP